MKCTCYLSIAVVVVAFSSCSQHPTQPGSGSNVLWPMAVGNRWIGTHHYYDVNGQLTGTRRDTMTIVGTADVNGETWYEFEDGALRINRLDGVWMRIPESDGDELSILFARYPTTRGDTFGTFEFQQTFENGQPGGSYVSWLQTLAVDSVVTVPYGTKAAHICAIQPLRTRNGVSTNGHTLPVLDRLSGGE